MSHPAVIRHVSFNQHYDCFALGTEEGIRIFNTDPLVEMIHLKSEEVGSVRYVSLLNRSNYVAMVSGPPRAKFGSNVVMIYDTKLREFIAEITITGKINGITMTPLRLIVLEQKCLHIFNMDKFTFIKSEYTGLNEYGLVALSPDPRMEYLVYPGTNTGSIMIVNIQDVSPTRSLAPNSIKAHDSTVARIAINNQATRVATGSIKGTLIRIFDTRTRDHVVTFRRGLESVMLHSMRFSFNSSFLAVSSDAGTVHVFSLDSKGHTHNAVNKLFDKIAGEERRSMIQFSLPTGSQAVECAFIDNSVSSGTPGGLSQDIVTVGYDGQYYRFSSSNPHTASQPQRFELLTEVNTDFWTV